MFRFKRITALLLAATLLFVGCSSGDKKASTDATASPERVLKDTITVAHWEEPSTLDPQASNKISFFVVEKQIFNTLVNEDAKGNISPGLAKKWEVIDDLTIRFYLRDDVSFHNGEKFTAEDVKYSIERGIKNPASSSTFKFFDAENTVIVDDYTIDIKFKKPYGAVYNTLASGRGGIVCKKAVEEMGDDVFARNPIGTGPYKMVEWKTGTEITLVKNDEYWGEKAKVKNIVFKVIPEAANRIIELETGGVDIVYNVSSNDVDRINGTENLEILMGPSFRYITLTFSMQDELLSNQKVRDALAYAIDKKSLVEAMYDDTAEVATGLMPANTFSFKAFEPVPYDVEKAKQLMAEAGYPDGFEIKFLVTPIEEYIKIAEAVQNMWKAIGVKVNMFTTDKASYEKQGNKFQASIRAGNANEPSNILIIYDSSFGDIIQPDDKYIDETLAKAAGIYDDAERKAIYEELQEYIWNSHYSIPVAFTNVIYAVNKNVENFECHPLNLTDLSKVSVYEN